MFYAAGFDFGPDGLRLERPDALFGHVHRFPAAVG
jgi:hypothetical protein